jgi:hypothetical protein
METVRDNQRLLRFYRDWLVPFLLIVAAFVGLYLLMSGWDLAMQWDHPR